MNKIIVVLVLLITLSSCKTANYPPLSVVDYVDIERYQGKWHEIARLPNSFQDDCYCSTAEYKIIDSLTISVKNECREDSINGELDYVNGKAFVVDGSNNAKLKVQFFWPFKGDYWIIDLDQDEYQYVTVGSPSRKYMWILARDPMLKSEQLNKLIDNAKNKGFAVENLIFTDESCNGNK
ncbi:MAG: lipocalin family protein [Bacteroidetes bacterium]|nr:lipocalin family protein [Bacteroidota bacterium]